MSETIEYMCPWAEFGVAILVSESDTLTRETIIQQHTEKELTSIGRNVYGRPDDIRITLCGALRQQEYVIQHRNCTYQPTELEKFASQFTFEQKISSGLSTDLYLEQIRDLETE